MSDPLLRQQKLQVDQYGNYVYKDTRIHAEQHETHTIQDITKATEIRENVFAYYNYHINCYNSVSSSKLSKIRCLGCFANFFLFKLFFGVCGGAGIEVFYLLFYCALAFAPYFNLMYWKTPELQDDIRIENLVMLGICSFCMLCLIPSIITLFINVCKSRCHSFKLMLYAPEICFGMQNRFYEVTVNNFLDVVGTHAEVTKNKIMGAIAMYREEIGSSSFTFMVYASPQWTKHFYMLLISFIGWLIISVVSVVNYYYAQQDIIIIVG